MDTLLGVWGLLRMTPEQKFRAIAITKIVKQHMLVMLRKHSNEVSLIKADSADPHTPIIGCMQMAFAQAAVEYLIACGCKPNEALQLAVSHIGMSMQHWCNTVIQQKAPHEGNK